VIDTRLVEYGDSTATPPTATTQVDGKQHVVLPGLGVNVRALDWLSIFAGFHRGFGPVAPGNGSTVDPELSNNFELGARVLDESRGIRAEVTGFVNDYTNLLVTCAGASGCDPESADKQFNASGVIVGGIEASYHHDVELNDDFTMPLRATYGYMRSRFQSSFATGDPQYRDVEVGDEVPYLPRHQATLLAGVAHERFSVNVTGTFVAKMREQAGSGDTATAQDFFTDPRAILDVTGEVRLRPRVHLTFRLENVTNSQPIVAHRPYGARPYRPFLAAAGFRVDL
jgi:Fe(3+) dicitrate transport protein